MKPVAPDDPRLPVFFELLRRFRELAETDQDILTVTYPADESTPFLAMSDRAWLEGGQVFHVRRSVTPRAYHRPLAFRIRFDPEPSK